MLRKITLLLLTFTSLSLNAQTTLLSEDFSGLALPTGWTNTGTGGSWTFSNQPTLSGIALATATVANGYAVFNSDILANDLLAENVDLITASFSCAGQNTVFLVFEDVFAQFANSSGTVSVSANNGPWVDVYTVGPGLPQSQINGNPNTENIDISAQAGNQANVRLRFKYQGDWDFWWVVDDILVYAPASFDAAIVDANISEYTSVPLSQVTPLTPSIEVLNNGGSAMTGVSVVTTITETNSNTVVYTSTTTQASVAVGAIASLTASTSYTPTDTGFYVMNCVVSIIQADVLAANDTFVTAIAVEDSLYARDLFLLTGNAAGLEGPWFLGAATDGQLGNVFKAEANTDLVSAIATFSGGFSIGDQTQANLYSMTGNTPGTLIASSSILTVSAADTPVIFYEFFFPSGTNLTAGNNYLISVQQNAASAAGFGLYSASDLYTQDKSFIKVGTGAWLEINTAGIGEQTFMIRANIHTPQPVCVISDITAGTQTACVNTTNNYTQEVTVTYAVPPSTGLLNVNGQTFPITSSPQNVTLTGLDSDGQAVIVTAFFTADVACTYTENNLFTAPTGCLCPTINVSVSTTNVTNCLNPNGSATAIATGGATANYTYAWTPSNFGTGSTITGIPSGSYSVIATDINGCSGSGSGNVMNTAGVNAVVVNVINPTCSSSSNGQITINTTGGTAPITYTWSDQGFPSNISSRSNLPAASYTVVVTDAVSCSANLGPIVLSAPSVVSAVLAGQGNVLCNGGSDGSIDMNVTGGTLPYVRSWTNSISTNEDLSGLSAGTYQLAVTDANNCPSVTGPQVTITEPAPISISLSSSTDASCNGGSDGSIDIIVTGGTPVYTYNWGAGVPATEDPSGLSAGSYQLVITDANNCPAVTGPSITIAEPSAISLAVASTDESNSGANDGTTSVIASGGTPPYVSYQWDDASSQTTASASNLSAGTYNVVVTDSEGCTQIIGVDVDLGNGIRDIELNKFQLYPNPANKELTISFETEDSDEYKVILYSTLGKILFEERAITTLRYKNTLDVSMLASGIYFIEVSSEKGKVLGKVTVNR